MHRPEDLVSRIGSEEFAILLPDTDEAGALRIAERVHAEVSMLATGSAGIEAGAVTVSIGLACAVPGGRRAGPQPDLYRLADDALYAAKNGGRNQTRSANPQTGPALVQKGALHLVRAS